MPRAAILLAFAASLALLPGAGRAALIPRLTLTVLCARSTDIVEARLTRMHTPGKPEWTDTFSATVLSTLAGSCEPGDRLPLATALSLYDPAKTGQHCLLFLARGQDEPRVRVVDMSLIDTHNRVRRYFQPSNPGGLQAEGFQMAETGRKKWPHGQVTLILTAVQSDTGEDKYPTLAEERRAIAAHWAAKQITH